MRRTVVLLLALLAACASEPPLPEANQANAAGTAPAPERSAASWYENDRFRFAVRVPAGFQAEPAPRNADGRVFVDPATGAELRASGSHNALNRSFEEQVEAAREALAGMQGAPGDSHLYRAAGTDGDGRRVHLLLVRPVDDRLVTLLFRYPEEAAGTMAPVAGETLDSLRAMQRVGPFSLRYDPLALAQTDAEIAIPPDWRREVRGLKLVARDRLAMLGRAECLYGLSGRATRCTAEKEAGLAFAWLEAPYARLRERLGDPEPVPVTLAGREGVSWEIGAEGEGAEHILLPADGGTLLIVRQYRHGGGMDEAAIRAVLDSLSLDGG